jgi:DNA polymerase-3 subunit gamma/tau
LVAASNEDLARLAQQGEGWSDTDLLRLMRLAAESQWPMRDSPQPLLHLEAAVLQMATLEPAESMAALIERLETLERRLSGGGSGGAGAGAGRAPAAAGAGKPSVSARPHGFSAPTAPAAPVRAASPPVTSARVTPPPAAAAPVTSSAPAASAAHGFTAPQATALETPEAEAAPAQALDGGVAATWKRTIAAVNGRKRMLGAFLEESRLVGIEGGALVLAMDHLHRSVVDAPEHRALVREELERAFGRPLELQCTVGEAVTHATQVAKADSLKPIIERAMEVFDGEVIERAPRGGDRGT